LKEGFLFFCFQRVQARNMDISFHYKRVEIHCYIQPVRPTSPGVHAHFFGSME
jgi:hypothetical protein